MPALQLAPVNPRVFVWARRDSGLVWEGVPDAAQLRKSGGSLV